MRLNSDPERVTHGDGDGYVGTLLFECIDDSTNGIVEKFGDLFPGTHRNWSAQATCIIVG